MTEIPRPIDEFTRADLARYRVVLAVTAALLVAGAGAAFAAGALAWPTARPLRAVVTQRPLESLASSTTTAPASTPSAEAPPRPAPAARPVAVASDGDSHKTDRDSAANKDRTAVTRETVAPRLRDEEDSTDEHQSSSTSESSDGKNLGDKADH